MTDHPLLIAMAKAHYEAGWQGWSIPRRGLRECKWDELGPTQERYIRQTRAALTALLEPTSDVVEAGVDFWNEHEDVFDSGVGPVFTAMINHILTNQGEG